MSLQNKERKSPLSLAVYDDMFEDDIPTELSSIEKLKHILMVQRLVFEKNSSHAKGQQRRIKGATCNVSFECDLPKSTTCT